MPKRQDGSAPFQRRVRKQRGYPHQAVDAHLDEHAGHDGRHMGRRSSVGARQPDVQRHEAGLEPEANQRQDENGCGRSRRVAVLIQGRQRELARDGAKHGEEAEETQRGRVRRHQVDPARFAGFFLVLFGHNQEKRRQRHDFPAEQEQNAVAGKHQQPHAGSQRPVEQAQPAAVLRMLRLSPVTQPVDVAQERDQEDRQQEDGRQAVNANAERCAWNRRRP